MEVLLKLSINQGNGHKLGKLSSGGAKGIYLVIIILLLFSLTWLLNSIE
jgi:hypothetical protein